MTKRRQEVRKGSHGAPLVLLAGLPHPTCSAVASIVEANLSPSARVIFEASGADGSNLYKKQTVTGLVRAVSEYAVRQLKAQTAAPTPTQIILAYVPAADDEQLLSEFDFFVFPVRLTRLAAYDHYGRQHRHNLTTTEEYVLSSIQAALCDFVEIKRRLSSISLREPLFLPPRNFKVSPTERMSDIFKELRQAERHWGSTIPEVRLAKVTHDDLPKHVLGGGHKEIFSDSRDLLFPHDSTNHGFARDLAPASSHEERKQFMRSSFRFGVPLISGYHHDVQYVGRDLGGATFECSVGGVVQLDSDYANVYPNDFVRPGKK